MIRHLFLCLFNESRIFKRELSIFHLMKHIPQMLGHFADGQSLWVLV